MGKCYTIIMQDDYDWNYVKKKKKDVIKEFSEEFKKKRGFLPTLEAQWYEHLVFDLDKAPADSEEVKEIILKHCDTCIYWDDYATSKKLELK